MTEALADDKRRRQSEADRKYYAANKEKRAAAARKWEEAHPERTVQRRREAHLKRLYGITSAQYDAMLAAQNFVCKICGTDTPGGNGKNFPVDHCHDTGRVRGLLCNACNTGIGKLRHSPDLLRQAACYLEENNARLH